MAHGLSRTTGKYAFLLHRASIPGFEHNRQAHDAPITKLSWAHPEFGPLIASASFDRTVKVWGQTSVPSADTQRTTTGNAVPQPVSSSQPSGSRWVERAVLVEAKGTVRSVEFAPHHFGLKLVSFSLADDHFGSCPRVTPRAGDFEFAKKASTLELKRPPSHVHTSA